MTSSINDNFVSRYFIILIPVHLSYPHHLLHTKHRVVVDTAVKEPPIQLNLTAQSHIQPTPREYLHLNFENFGHFSSQRNRCPIRWYLVEQFYRNAIHIPARPRGIQWSARSRTRKQLTCLKLENMYTRECSSIT